MAEIDKLIPDGANVFFAHTMAGGIPRIKAFLAIANRIYKGRGERFMAASNWQLPPLALKSSDRMEPRNAAR